VATFKCKCNKSQLSPASNNYFKVLIDGHTNNTRQTWTWLYVLAKVHSNSDLKVLKYSSNRRGLWWPFCGFWVCSGSGNDGFSQPPYPDLYFQYFLCFSSFCYFSYILCYGNILLLTFPSFGNIFLLFICFTF